MKFKQTLLLLLFLPLFITANPVSKKEIKNLGNAAFVSLSYKYSPASADNSLRSVDYLTEDGELYAALLHFDKGFLLIAADDAVAPVLAYGFDNDLQLQNMAPATEDLLEQYKNEILFVRRNNIQPDARALEAWNELFNPKTRDSEQPTSVGPLLRSSWNQNKYYNYYSPYDEDSPNGYDNRTPNGCVAVAMSQIIYYYRYPERGANTHTNHSSYGDFFVDYGNTTYTYDAMCDVLSHNNNEVAKLIFHCGVAVDMNYGPEGSGAYSWDVPLAMIKYFRYSDDIKYVSKHDFSSESWDSLLISQLNQLRPIYYSGYAEDGGHAFVCDGYNEDHFFHFNFGWGGSGDGYFVTTATSDDQIATGGYSHGQAAVINFCPPDNAYPEYCNDRIITPLYGYLEDGSGNKNYGNNQYCTYIITSPTQYSVQVSIKELDIQEGHDYLRFWDRHPSNDSLLLELTGGMPQQVTYFLNTDSLYITFETDNDTTASGWRLYYLSKRNEPGCSVYTHTSDTGTFSDNSGDLNYSDNSTCVWNIRINDANYIKFTFQEFDISPEDVLEIFDISQNPQQLLVSLTGSDIPDPMIFHTNKVRARFTTDNYLNAQGFKIFWSTNNTVGIMDDGLNQDNTTIYPNPVNNAMTIDLATDGSSFNNVSINIYDIVGNCVYSNNNVTENKVTVNTEDFANGMYLVKFNFDGRTSFKKIVIKH